MTCYNFIKWMVVNRSDPDPLKFVNPDKTFWGFEAADAESRELHRQHPDHFFTAVQVIVPYEPSPVIGLGGNGPLGNYAPNNPVDPHKLQIAMSAIQDAFPSMNLTTPSTTTPVHIANHKDKEENLPNGKV